MSEARDLFFAGTGRKQIPPRPEGLVVMTIFEAGSATAGSASARGNSVLAVSPSDAKTPRLLVYVVSTKIPRSRGSMPNPLPNGFKVLLLLRPAACATRLLHG